MLAIMGNALQPTQQLFVITIVEPENKTFFSFPIGAWSNLPLLKCVSSYRI